MKYGRSVRPKRDKFIDNNVPNYLYNQAYNTNSCIRSISSMKVQNGFKWQIEENNPYSKYLAN